MDSKDLQTDTHHAGLRAWARGQCNVEAATEVLIRSSGGRFALPGNSWIEPDSSGGYWIDFSKIVDNAGVLSGGESRILMVAASIGCGEPVDLNWALTSLDRASLALMLAAIAHAGGSHEHTEFLPTRTEEGLTSINLASPRLALGPLFDWPAD